MIGLHTNIRCGSIKHHVYYGRILLVALVATDGIRRESDRPDTDIDASVKDLIGSYCDVEPLLSIYAPKRLPIYQDRRV